MLRNLKFKQYDDCHIENIEPDVFTIQSVDGDVYEIEFSNFNSDFQSWIQFLREEEDPSIDVSIGASFACYNNRWEIADVTTWDGMGENFNLLIKEHTDKVDNQKKYIDICQKFVDENRGQRLYYFNSFAELENWFDLIQPLEETDIDVQVDQLKQFEEFLVYISTDGEITITNECPGFCPQICDENNIFYDKEQSENNSISIIDKYDLCGESVRYMLAKGMLKNLSLEDENHVQSYNVTQENIDFILRYYRRGNY